MPDKSDLKRAYFDEKRRGQGMSDSELAQRQAELEEAIKIAEQEYVASLQELVRRGGMTAEDATKQYEAFQNRLRELKVPFGAN